MSAIDFLSGVKVLEERDSQINGKLTVVKDIFFGTYIKGGGLPQSGGLAKTIWEKTLKKIIRSTDYSDPKTILILGFAGGGIAHISRELWPECDIFGVDIDPVMVDLGKKYLDWENTEAKVWIQDAEEFIEDILLKKNPHGEMSTTSQLLTTNYQLPIAGFDLVCVDMYVGAGVPEKFSTLKFIKLVDKIVGKDGLVIYNRLFGKDDRGEAKEFQNKLEKKYSNIFPVYPEANVMFLCANN